MIPTFSSFIQLPFVLQSFSPIQFLQPLLGAEPNTFVDLSSFDLRFLQKHCNEAWLHLISRDAQKDLPHVLLTLQAAGIRTLTLLMYRALS